MMALVKNCKDKKRCRCIPKEAGKYEGELRVNNIEVANVAYLLPTTVVIKTKSKFFKALNERDGCKNLCMVNTNSATKTLMSASQKPVSGC